MEWDTVIGLEVHAQLSTQSKLFSGAPTLYGAQPNLHTCFIDAGLPGVLPVLNQQAVVMAIQFGLAVNADINDLSVFERKNYFYPDLPKGYQISQFQKPVVSNGELEITLEQGSLKKVHIQRAHLEEDAGKSLHDMHPDFTGIDLNRAGTPLLEIVTSPCLDNAQQALCYLKTLHQLLRFLAICDGNMQEGSFRCDVNVSLKPKGSAVLGTRTELKNLNSFKHIEKAIAHEQWRHQEILEQGHAVIQETRLYNPDTDSTHPMRSKENENDYRYFPDPDLLPIQITRFQIAEIKHTLPDLPTAIYKSLKQIAALHEEDIQFIMSSPAIYNYYKQVKFHCLAPDKLLINWLKGHFSAALNEYHLIFENAPIAPATLAALLDKIHQTNLTAHVAKAVFAFLWAGEQDIEAILLREGLAQQDNNDELEALIQQLLAEYPAQVKEYKAGKEKLLAFFVGHIMKKTKGQANPEQTNKWLKKYLSQD